MFNKSTKIYQEAIYKSGYNYKLKFEKKQNKMKMEKRKEIEKEM